MTTTYSQRTIVTRDVPTRLLTLDLPPGVTLDRWVKAETERLRLEYPKMRNTSAEMDPEFREMLTIARADRTGAERRYELLKLELRAQLGAHRQGTANGIPFIARRQTPIEGHVVDPYVQDALFPC